MNHTPVLKLRLTLGYKSWADPYIRVSVRGHVRDRSFDFFRYRTLVPVRLSLGSVIEHQAFWPKRISKNILRLNIQVEFFD